jgi:hypothetical protein
LSSSWICPECNHIMIRLSENEFICCCGRKLIQLSIYDDGGRPYGANEVDEKGTEGKYSQEA